MSTTLVTIAAWLAVVAFTVSAVLFGQGARMPSRPPRHARAARNRRVGTALSISGPITVVLLSLGAAALTREWLLVAVVAFALVGAVALAGLVLAPR